MSLIISETKETYYLNGTINSATSNYLKNHFSLIQEVKEELTINIDGVINIDSYGVSILKDLYKNAIHNNSKLWIVGNGCKDIYNELKFSDII